MVTITTEQVWLTWRPQIPQSTVDDKVAILVKLEKNKTKQKKNSQKRDYKSFTMIILSSNIQFRLFSDRLISNGFKGVTIHIIFENTFKILFSLTKNRAKPVYTWA